MSRALVLFSGGQDSTICLAHALARHEWVETIGFDYGQRHAVEMLCRERILACFRADFPEWAPRLGADHRLDLSAFGAIGDNFLTNEAKAGSTSDISRPGPRPGSRPGIPLPEIPITEAGLPASFVPGRNLAFLTFAAALAYGRGIDVLIGGMCETDFSGYPDCRRATLDAMETALSLGLDRKMQIETPLMALSKAESWVLARDLGGDKLVELVRVESHSCYHGRRDLLHVWGMGCGLCPACQLREAGWRAFRAMATAS